MTAMAWQELKGLMVNPSEVLEGILARQSLALSLALGMISYYWRTLQISEVILPSSLGGWASFLLNFPLALGWMALIVLLIHLAARMVGPGKGRWGDLLSLWGYTQLPAIVLIGLGAAFFATAPMAPWVELGIAWLIPIVGLVLVLSLWGLILKIQALKVCYDVHGKRLLSVIGLAVLLYGSVAWLEMTFLDEQGLVPQQAFHAMEPSISPVRLGRKNISLPFERLTYRLRSPRRQEIVGFVLPGREGLLPFTPGFRVRYLGRIAGLPGEKVEVREGRVLINDQPLAEPYLVGRPAIDVPPTRVPSGHFFILGDNRSLPPAAYGGGIVPEGRIRGRMTNVGRMKWQLMVGNWPW